MVREGGTIAGGAVTEEELEVEGRMNQGMGVGGSSGRYCAFCSHYFRVREVNKFGGGRREGDGVGRLLIRQGGGYRFEETEILLKSSVQSRLLAHRFVSCQIMPSIRFALVAGGLSSRYSYYFLSENWCAIPKRKLSEVILILFG